MSWIPVEDRSPDFKEPIVYARPDRRRGAGHWHVGVAYRTVSEKWNPEMESTQNPGGFTHWIPLPDPPKLTD